MCGEHLLDNVRKIYKEYNIYESIFIALVTSFSIFIILKIAFEAFSYFYEAINLSYIEILPFILSFTLFLFIVLKPDLEISSNKKILLISEIVFSFIVIYVIL